MRNIYINYCKNSDIAGGTLELLKAGDLKDLVRSDMRVSLKPNMVTAKHPSLGATTHSEVAEGIIIYLKELGVNKIEIIESAWIGDSTKRAYKACGYDILSKKYGVPLHDLKDDKIKKVKSGEFNIEICERALETDFLINIPVLKAHCQTRFTCNLKNLKGCISDSEKRKFHTLGLHKPIAYLNAAVKTHYCVVDGICGDLSFEEGGTPVERNMLICGADPVLVDSYCCELIGWRADEIGYLKIAREIGVGEYYNENTPVIEINKENKIKPATINKKYIERLAAYISEDSACSACYSSLVYALHRSKKLSGQEKIHIGQGKKGKTGKLGCGNCASGFDSFIPGCPPKSVDIVKFLGEL